MILSSVEILMTISCRNQTNLALKGIIALEAMSQIANLTNHADDGAYYSEIAHDYIDQWQVLGINSTADPPHSTLSYNEPESHGKCSGAIEKKKKKKKK